MFTRPEQVILLILFPKFLGGAKDLPEIIQMVDLAKPILDLDTRQARPPSPIQLTPG